MQSDISFGVGTPFVRLSDLKGKTLIDASGINLGRHIHEFSYRYDEDNGDKCTIVFLTRSPLNTHCLMRGVAFYVSWGFIQSRQNLDVSVTKGLTYQTRKIQIDNINADYGADGIRIVLECIPPAAKAIDNKIPAAAKNFINFVDNISQGKFKYDISYDDKVLVSNYKSPATYDGSNMAEAKNNATIVFQRWIDSPLNIITAGKDRGTALRNELRYAPGGPFSLGTRDDTISVKKKYNFNQNVFRAYKYKGSPEVKLITITEEDDMPDLADVQVFSADANNKKLNALTQIMVGQNANASTDTKEQYDASGDSSMDKTHTKSYHSPDIVGFGDMENAQIYQFNKLKEYMDMYVEGVDKDGIPILQAGSPAPIATGNLESSPLEPIVQLKVYQKHDSYDADGNLALGTDHELELGYAKLPLGLLTADPDYEKAKDMIMNQHTDAVLKKIKINVTLDGDPTLISGKVEHFTGLSSNHNGKYFIISCEHRISSKSGYSVVQDGVKAVNTLNGSTMTSSTKVTTDGKTEKASAKNNPFTTTIDYNHNGKIDVEDVMIDQEKRFNTHKPKETPNRVVSSDSDFTINQSKDDSGILKQWFSNLK